MVFPTFVHLLWMAAGAIAMRIIQGIWNLFATVFGVGFREGLAAAIKKGGPLTPEETAALRASLKDKIAKKLEHDAEQDLTDLH